MSNASRKLRLSDEAQVPSRDQRPHSPLAGALPMLLIGGASLILLALMSVSLRPESPAPSIGWWVFSLSFIVNFPHFLVSYQMLYVDFGERIFKDLRFFWAGVVAPILLVGVLLAGFALDNPKILGVLASSMYFFVGWHYVKQIFGGISVSNAMIQFYYNKIERAALKANLFSLWAISFLIPNIGDHSYAQDGIGYSSIGLPDWTLSIAYTALALSGVAVVITNVQKYIREGKTPSPTALVCFLTIYAWYLPALSHPMFMHLIPFFHSLQYLMFVYIFRRNKVNATIGQPDSPEGRKKKVIELYGYLAVPFLTGALFMFVIPRFIDTLHLQNAQVFGPTAAYFSFIIFINVHHYFIDNVMWRGNNPEMRKHLFQTAR